MFIELGLLGTSLVLLVTIVAVLAYLGFFHQPEVSTGLPPLAFSGRTLAFKCHRDGYSGIGFQFTKQYNFTAVQAPPVKLALGRSCAVAIYYDSPDESRDQCRFLVGLLLHESAECAAVREALAADGYRFTEMPDIDHVVRASFPYRSYMAVYLAIRKVYPLINAYIKVGLLGSLLRSSM